MNSIAVEKNIQRQGLTKGFKKKFSLNFVDKPPL